MSKDMTLAQAITSVDDPSTTGTDLHIIAAKHPMLRADVANHPKVDADLLDWLAEVGDDEVQAIVEARLGTVDDQVYDPDPNPTSATMRLPTYTDPPDDQPAPDRNRIIVAIVVAVALVAAAVVAGWLVFRRPDPANVAPPTVTVTQTIQPTDTQPTDTQPTDSQPTTETTSQTPVNQNPYLASDPPVAQVIEPLRLPTLPALSTAKVQVKTDGFNKTPIQKLADDIAAGNVEKIVKSCWTQPASELRLIYGSVSMRGAILQALKTYPIKNKETAIWSGEHVKVIALLEEVYSPYTCVMVDWAGDGVQQSTFTPAMAQLQLKRVVGLYDDKLVNSQDGTGNYELICHTDCGGSWAAHKMGNPGNPKEMAPIMYSNPGDLNKLRQLSQAPLIVERLQNGYFRVRAADGSTQALAYFTGEYTHFQWPYLLGEVA